MSFPLSTAGLARLSARHPWRTLAVWVVVLVLSAVAASGLAGALTTEGNFTNKPESVRGLDLLEERMDGAEPLTETVIVRSDTLTVDDPQFQQIVEQTTTNLLGMSGVVASAGNYYQATAAGMPEAERMVSPDRHATIIPVTLAIEGDDVSTHAEAYGDAVARTSGGEVEVLTVGSLSVHEAFTTLSEDTLQRAERYALPITLVILVVVFGALVAAGVPLILALTSVFVALGLTALLGQVMDLSFYVVNMIFMIGLAVGIDYALFIISRYREERRRGLAKIDAISVAGGTASKAVLFSGLTVVFALSGLLLMPSTIFRSLGAGAVLVVVVAIAAMLTLVPAVLSLLGDRIDWPRRRRPAAVPADERRDEEATYRGFWGTITRAVMRRPVISALAAAGLLVAATIPYFDLQRGSLGIETFPDGEIKTGYTILERDFSAGVLAPIEIVVDGPRSPEVDAGIARLVAAIDQNPAFVPITQAAWNQSGDLALVRATLVSGANGPQAYDTLERLRDRTVPAAFQGTNAVAYVTGATAFNADFFQMVDDSTPLIFAFVLGLSFLLLLVAFRSIVVPIKAILLNLLSVGASYGLIVLVFQKGYLHEVFGFQRTPTIEAWVPIFLFCVLFGLSMDYHVFLLSRIRERYDRTGDNRDSVAVGLQATARLITGAALIMVVVFAGFAAGDLAAFQQMGFGLAVAVLLDATIVRSVLVPSSMALLGNANWYLPRWLRWLPDLRIEGGDAHLGPEAAPVPKPVAGDD